MTGRRILIGLGVLAALVVVLMVWLAGSVNAVVKAGVERYGSRITDTDVRVASVNLELRKARGTLRGLRIENPEGFSREDALSLGEITLDVEGESLARDPIVIDQIRIAGPQVLVELAENGRVNLRSLEQTVEKYAPGPRDGGKDGSGGEGKAPPRVLVKELTVEGGKIRLDARAVGGELTEREMGTLRLRDIGAPNGVRADELGQRVLEALLSEALDRSAVDALRKKAEDKLEQVGKSLLKGLAD